MSWQAKAGAIVKLLARHQPWSLVIVVFGLVILGGAELAATEQPQFHVSQKGRAFNPGELDVKRGDVVEIVNDDGDLLHHAYVDSDTFSFDSGDQEPGSKTDVKFTVPGTFTVLCGIHPKMKMVVRVH